MDYIPQRDAGPSASPKPLHLNPQQEAHARVVVSKLERVELEDKYLRSQEENIMLKRHVRKQEDKIKRISTKLIRLVNDRKKWSSQTSQPGKRSNREITLEETIETQQDQIRRLEKENESFKQKLHVSNQQLLTQGRRHTPYGYVQSRIDTGGKRPVSARDRQRSGVRSRSPAQDSMATSLGPKYGHSLLEEAREENRNMHNVILGLQQQLANMEREHNQLQNEIRLKNAAHEDDVLKFTEQINHTKKNTLTENIELIRLQRETKEKMTALQSLEARYHELQDTHHHVRGNYDKVLSEMENLKSKLLEEEGRSFNLQNQMKHGSRSENKSAEMQQMIYDLEREAEILKDANERLTNNAFASDQEQKWHRVEHELRKQIAQLESVVQYDLKDKDSVLQKAASERAINDRMQDERRRLHEECTRLRTDNQDLRNRLRLVSSLDDAVDETELEEALAVIRQKRHLAVERKRPDFLEAEDDDGKDVDTLYNELQVQHADTIQELEKTREMLLMQHRINKDYQIEVESVSNKMEEMKREYEGKLEHFAQLLDARAARIKKLEKQLNDVAYGTKQFKYKPDEEEELEVGDDAFDIARLERGENLLEINITKVTLSRDALQAIDDREPSTFITFAFYDYELVSTPIIKSGSPRFDFTSQYIVKVDDLFLHHLQKDSTLMELHQAFGTDFKTLCACKIRLNQLLDKPQGKLHGSAILTGVADGTNYGNLDFWVRLRVPMDQAIRLYKERTKALGYLAANSAATQKQLDTQLTLREQDENFNQLELRITSCNHVQSLRTGVQPNIYCVYKFYDFPDHDTTIIPNTNNPHFDDEQFFPVQMTSDLDAYLKSEKLVIYVFDDADPDMSSYLGKASVDLIPLAHDKVIRAPFQLYRPDRTENGTVEISLRWKLSYKAPASVMKIPESDTERLEKQQEQMIPEKLVTQYAKPKVMPPVQKVQKPAKVLHSTPKPKPPDAVVVEAPRPPEQTDPKVAEVLPFYEPVSESERMKPNEEITPLPEPVKVIPKPKARTLKQTGSFEQQKDDLPRKEHLDVPEQKEVKPKPRKVQPTRVVSPPDSAIEESIEEEMDEEITEELDGAATDAEDIETDSDVVVMESSNATKKANVSEEIRISVNHLTLHPESWVWKDQEIQRLFVEYTFLDVIEETPTSLPKPKDPNQEISYNFSKVTHIDEQNNEKGRTHLLGMLLPDSGVEPTINFIVVSEPTDDENECEELGTATVDLQEILKNGCDVTDVDLDIVGGTECIGRLNVSVEALDALKSVVEEVRKIVLQKSKQRP